MQFELLNFWIRHVFLDTVIPRKVLSVEPKTDGVLYESSNGRIFCEFNV